MHKHTFYRCGKPFSSKWHQEDLELRTPLSCLETKQCFRLPELQATSSHRMGKSATGKPAKLSAMRSHESITEHLCSGCSPLPPHQSSPADIFPFSVFGSPYFLALSLHQHPHLILSSRQGTRVTPCCLNLLLCAPSLVSSCRNHFCKIPGKGEMSGLHTVQLKP